MTELDTVNLIIHGTILPILWRIALVQTRLYERIIVIEAKLCFLLNREGKRNDNYISSATKHISP